MTKGCIIRENFSKGICMQNIFESFTHQMSQSVESGISLALHSKNSEVVPLHIVWGLLTNSDSLLLTILRKMNVEKSAIELEVKSYVERLPKSSSVTKESIRLSREAMESFQEAQALMVQQGDSYLSVDPWLLSVSKKSPIKDLFSKYFDISEFAKNIELIVGVKILDAKTR